MKICQKICTYSCLHSQFAFTFKMSVVAFWLQMFTSKYHQNQWLAQNTGLSNPGFYWEMNKDFWSCSIFLVIFLHQNDFLLPQFHANMLANSAICNSLPWILGVQGPKTSRFHPMILHQSSRWPTRSPYFPWVSAQYSPCWPVVTSKNTELLLPHGQSFTCYHSFL